MVYGDSLKNCCVAIVVIEPNVVKKWAEENGKEGDVSALSKDADLKKTILDSMVECAKSNKLNTLEKPQDIYVTHEEFSIENDMMTPTFKLKRHIARNVYMPEITHMYTELAKKGK